MFSCMGSSGGYHHLQPKCKKSTGNQSCKSRSPYSWFMREEVLQLEVGGGKTLQDHSSSACQLSVQGERPRWLCVLIFKTESTQNERMQRFSNPTIIEVSCSQQNVFPRRQIENLWQSNKNRVAISTLRVPCFQATNTSRFKANINN